MFHLQEERGCVSNLSIISYVSLESKATNDMLNQINISGKVASLWVIVRAVSSIWELSLFEWNKMSCNGV